MVKFIILGAALTGMALVSMTPASAQSRNVTRVPRSGPSDSSQQPDSVVLQQFQTDQYLAGLSDTGASHRTVAKRTHSSRRRVALEADRR